MLKNLVKETANNPGTGTSISLLGTMTGYVTFISQFGSGAEAMYYITNGTVTELNTGIVTAGSPNLLARGTPLWRSDQAGPVYTRASFTGAVTIYSAQGADQTLYADRSNLWQARSRRLTALADATGSTDAVAYGQLGWRFVSESISGSSQANVDFNVPAGATRLRFEFADCAPTVAADFHMRVNRGAGFLVGGSDYIYVQNNAPNANDDVVSLVGADVSETVMGFVEMQTNAKDFGYAITSSPIAGPFFVQCVTSFGLVNTGAALTQVRFGFNGMTVSVAAHRIRMLAQRA